jgi:hypothetical protein
MDSTLCAGISSILSGATHLVLDAELGGFDELCWLRGLEGGGGELGMVREEAGKRMHFVA